MPNWCNNTITMSGPKDKIKKIWDNKDKGFLQQLYPMPAELEGTTSPAPKEGEPQPLVDGYDNWYDWRVSNWSTKWDVDTEGLELVENNDSATIQGWFDSAWAPPIGAYEQLAADFDSCIIEASYFEPGMDFAGFWSSENGEEHLDNLHDEWEKGDDASDLYKQLDDEYNLSEQFQEWDEEFNDAD